MNYFLHFEGGPLEGQAREVGYVPPSRFALMLPPSGAWPAGVYEYEQAEKDEKAGLMTYRLVEREIKNG